jgi:hypothetical protein
MAFDVPERFLGGIHGQQAFLRSAAIMQVRGAGSLIVIAPSPGNRTLFRSAEIATQLLRKASVASAIRSCILIFCINPTAHFSCAKSRLHEPRLARQGGR